MRTTAHLLSVLFHPVWMPTLVLGTAFQLDPHLAYSYTEEGRWIILGTVFAMTALFPVMSALMMDRTGVITTLSMPGRRERLLPFTVSLMYYGMCYYLLRRTPAHPMLWSLFFGAMVALTLTLLITFFWKISVHMVGMGGLVGAFLAMVLQHGVAAWPVLGLLFVLAGALGTARLLVSDHTPAQIYGGALLGGACAFCCTMAQLWF